MEIRCLIRFYPICIIPSSNSDLSPYRSRSENDNPPPVRVDKSIENFYQITATSNCILNHIKIQRKVKANNKKLKAIDCRFSDKIISQWIHKSAPSYQVSLLLA